MKAMVLKAANTPFVFEILPDPTPGPNDAVARVLSCGSGLTIQHVKAGRSKALFPRIIGHEITGEIVETGSKVKDLKIGDPVTAYYYLYCSNCHWCQSNLEPLCENNGGNVGKDCDGGYAELIKLPVQNFIKLPPGLEYKKFPAEIGVISDAVATPVKVLKRARVTAGETVAVFGAGGGIGIHMLMLARRAQTRVIAIDIATNKFDACGKAGADEIVDASEAKVSEAILDLTKGKGVDVVIDFVSTALTLETGMAILGRRGRLITLGGHGQKFTADAATMLLKEQELLGSRYVTRREVVDALNLVANGDIWPMVTDIRPWEEAEKLHELLEKGDVTGRAALLIGAERPNLS